MFHVNAWGLPYAAAWSAPSWCFPGRAWTASRLHDLFETEGVTVRPACRRSGRGCWRTSRRNDLKFSTMRRTVIGGSACPPAMMRAFQEHYGVQVLHAWGMTEMSPLGTVCTLKPKHRGSAAEEQMAVQAKQGRAVFGVDMKIVGDDGEELPRDGKASGELLVRGPWIIAELLQGRRRRPAGRTAGSPPATSRPSMPTATCRSPTAART